ncbi:MAG: dual specificity protein phosphatase family protein [Chloroflexi bacterium]|nr:dual specificity protein phosphatase family protein [Chloroflexota bacterium]
MEFTDDLPDVDLSWVTSQLAVGGQFGRESIPVLMGMGIRVVVDMRNEGRDDQEMLERYGITLRHLPTLDYAAPSRECLLDTTDWIRERIESGERVLIHCQQGTRRSVTLTCAVLIREGVPPETALQLVRQRRPGAAPTPEQIGALIAFDRYLKVAAGDGDRRP